MRAWLYNRVKALTLPTGDDPADILSSAAATNPTPPFLILSMGVEQPPLGGTQEERTQRIPFTVWVHDAGSSMVKIDDACIALKQGIPSLNNFMIGNLSVYEVRWEETGQDAFDDFFKTNTRPVRFAAMTRR
jgi:hypothetical protein